MKFNLGVVLSVLFLLTAGLEKPAIAGWGHSDPEPESEAAPEIPSSAVQPDGTISNEQPDSDSWFGYSKGEGYCGQTAAANVIQMLMGNTVTVEQAARECTDFTPGTRDDTLRDYLEQETGKDWSIVAGTSRDQALNNLVTAVYNLDTKARGLRITPIPVHVSTSNKGSHWVTVVGVDTTAGIVTFNQWGGQYTEDLDTFMGRWRDGYITGAISRYTLLYPKN